MHTTIDSQQEYTSLLAAEAVKRTKEDVILANRQKALEKTEAELDDFDLSTKLTHDPEGMSEEEKKLRADKKEVFFIFFV